MQASSCSSSGSKALASKLGISRQGVSGYSQTEANSSKRLKDWRTNQPNRVY